MNDDCSPHSPQPIPLWQSSAWFLGAGLLLYVLTHWGIPFWTRLSGWPVILSWFLVGGLGVFLPLFISSLICARRSSESLWQRLRLRPLNRNDGRWFLRGFLMIALGTAAVTWLLQHIPALLGIATPDHPSPPFLPFTGFEPGQQWMLLPWLLFFFFNILGEELMWRGCLLPRQIARHGEHAWLLNALLWTLFHFCFGWYLLIMLLPILWVIPYVVQKSGNTWVGVLLHGFFNGSAFLALSLRLF